MKFRKNMLGLVVEVKDAAEAMVHQHLNYAP